MSSVRHSRLRPLIEVPLVKIISNGNIDADDPYVRLYQRLLKGEIKVGLTRIPIESITSGYFKRTGDGVAHVSDLKNADIPFLEREIRGGGRPSLDLYWNPHVPGGGGYVCADDEVVLAAYKQLNFALVPCRILNPRKFDLPEACLWIEQRGKDVGLAKSCPPKIDNYALFADSAKLPFADLIDFLKNCCRKTCSSIVKFHCEANVGVHYHQMLHALVVRHERLLDSIHHLVEIGRFEHASSLIRIGYESFLNFYIDWLSPEFLGPRLQYLSAVRAAKFDNPKEIKDKLTILSNFPILFEKTIEKAQISPLGLLFHNIVYPELSLIAHQSYIFLERDAKDFQPSEKLEDPSDLETFGRWINILTAALLIRVENDVGITPTRPKS